MVKNKSAQQFNALQNRLSCIRLIELYLDSFLDQITVDLSDIDDDIPNFVFLKHEKGINEALGGDGSLASWSTSIDTRCHDLGHCMQCSER